LCEGTKTKIFLNLPKPLFGLVQCLNCGLVYLDPRPSPSEIGKYYSTDYYTSQAPEIAEKGLREQIKRLAHQARGQTHDGNLLQRAKWKFLELALSWRAARGVPPRRHGRLLDVGCGNGEYAAWIRDNVSGWQAEGVEFNEHAAVQARRAFGLTVHTGNLTELN
jgi:SAM-dependent methyltransferase